MRLASLDGPLALPRPMGCVPIAIVGAACRLPRAPGLDALAELLFAGRDAVGEIPPQRWARELFHHPAPGQAGRAYTMAAGCLDQVDGFDPGFFGISAREAAHVDPQQRLMLELAHEAMEDAGAPAAHLAGRAVGVFIGAAAWDYSTIAAADPNSTDAHSMQGVALSSLSNRLSYQFDLRGPSLTIDTACSSALVALHQACESVRRGESVAALAGGVNLLLAPHAFIGFSRAAMLSRRGRCQAFDAAADGYVRAEGGGMVLLKRLAAARADGDPVRAVILASGVNSDGRTPGFSVPSAAAQERLLRAVHDQAGIAAEDLGYFEAHGTGTPVGDPLEAEAIGRAVARLRRTRLPIGSVKTNLGHLEAASGMAGLMKVIVALERGVIPASLHFRVPNPRIDFGSLNLEVVTAPRPMAAGAGGLVAGLNSFGFGGTNAHVVLTAGTARAPARPARAPAALPPLLLSARAPAALRALALDWQARLTRQEPAALAPLVRGAARLRDHHPHRLAVPGDTPGAMAAALAGWLADAPAGTDRVGRVGAGQAVAGRLAFVFSGNGSQWAGMARDALAHSAAFRAMLREVDAALAPLLGWSVAARLRAPADAQALRSTAIAQPLLFAVQVGCVAALRAQGVVADAHVGHSVGEVAAAWAAGALDLGQAARVIAVRSAAQQRRHGVGGMAVLGLGEAAAEQALARIAPGLALAAVNSARSVTVAGPAPALDRLARHAAAMGWTHVRLDLDYAFHCALMDPIEAEISGALADLAPAVPAVPLVSTVTGALVRQAALDARHWWRNVRAPVRFAEALAALGALGARQFLEIGPLAVLQSYLREAVADSGEPGRVLASLTRTPAEGDPFPLIAARCYAAGASLAGAAALAGPASARGLPLYPWQRERHWLARTEGGHDIVAPARAHPLLGWQRPDRPDIWFSHPCTATAPWLGEHVVDGAPVLPAAAIIEMALAAGRARHGQAPCLELRDLEIGRAVALEATPARELSVRLAAGESAFSLTSRARLSAEPPSLHATGQVLAGAATPLLALEPRAGDTELDAAALYRAAAALRLQYGPAFRTVRRLCGDGTHAVVELAPEQAADRTGHLIDPALLDGALQGLIGLAAGSTASVLPAAVLPWRFERVRLLRPAGAVPARAVLHLRHRGTRSLLADIVLLDAAGEAVMELLGCWFAAIGVVPGPDPAGRAAWTALVASAIQPACDTPDLLDRALAPCTAADAAPESLLLAEAMLALAVRDAAAAQPGRPAAPELLRWLEQDGLARREDASWRIAASDALAPWPEIWQSLLFDVPDAAAETALAGVAARAVPAILAGGWEAAPTPAPALLEQMLFASPTGAGALAALLAAVAAFLEGWPAGRPLRVAQTGAVWPGFTRRMLALLVRRAPGFRFVALTARPAALADCLAGQAGASASAAAGEDVFDLVVGLYPFAPPMEGAVAPADAAALLASGGHLLAIEAVPCRLWQVVFGGRHAAGGPPPDLPAVWQADLEAAGCARSRAVVLAGGQLWQAALIGARCGAETAAQAELPVGLAVFAAAGDGLAQALGGAHELATLADWRGRGPVVVMLPEQEPASLLALLAGALPAVAAAAHGPVWVVTRDRGVGAPLGAAVLGLLRTLANEVPGLDARLLRLDPALAPAVAVRHLAAELAAAEAEPEVVCTASGRLVRRLRQGLPPPPAAGPVRLAIARPGVLASLRWEAFAPPPPGPGEVAIEVRAAGLNFRDLMWAQGLLPEEALIGGFSGVSLGLECAGVVAAVGVGVADLAPGDAVIAVAPAALATHVVTARRAVMRLPAGLDMAAGATIPVAFLTAVYALGHLARLQPGERVLVHGGLGGLGLAAIQYARHRGAVVYATAGSPARREVLALLGLAGVFDSRDPGFADALLAATGGEGVDVVLNSLSGALMQAGLRVLRPFGRFIEVGKRDLYADTSMGLRALRRNVSWFAVDADALAAQRPALTAALLEEIAGLLATGRLRPLPCRRYGFDEAEDAFRQLQASGHVGKIVLTPAPVAGTAAPAGPWRAEGTYLLSGALEGFGLAAAEYLARGGARHLALLSRRGAATPGADRALAALRAQGAEVAVFACDVADPSALAATLARIRATMPPLAGVFHAAMVLDDGWAGALDPDRIEAVLRPKLAGAAALDRLTREDPLHCFVLFSSVTTLLGNPGQASYVAANAAMEAIAEARQAAGLPALAVGWGPIGDAGTLARDARVSAALERLLGRPHATAAVALAALPALLASGVAVCTPCDLPWRDLARSLPALRTRLLADLPAETLPQGGEALRRHLAALPPEAAAGAVLPVLVEAIAAILRDDPARIDPDQALGALGMDSLTAVELRGALAARLDIDIPLAVLSPEASLRALAARIASLRPAPPAEAVLLGGILRHEPEAALLLDAVP
jgi:acyl transferase domain-containing protein/NADPH:quinone reductase-like Zn-dependent oxidoreductase/acyl carrier protein